MSYFCYVHNWANREYECPSCNKERVRTYATDSTTVSLPIVTLKDPTPCANYERLEMDAVIDPNMPPLPVNQVLHETIVAQQKEIQRLQKQLEMCIEALNKILGKNEYCINKEPHKFIADECLAKLEKE